MGKTDALLREMGGNLAESIGVRSGTFRTVPPGPKPADPGRLPQGRLHPGPVGRGDAPREHRPRPRPAAEGIRPGAIERLAESIKAKGLLQPLRVRWNPDLGKHVILVGERRYRAATPGRAHLGPVHLRRGGADPGRDPRGAARREPAPRGPEPDRAGPLLQARTWSSSGCHAKDLAHLLKISPSTVTRALSLLKLPEAGPGAGRGGGHPGQERASRSRSSRARTTQQDDGRAGRRRAAHGRRHRQGRAAEEGQGGAGRAGG